MARADLYPLLSKGRTIRHGAGFFHPAGPYVSPPVEPPQWTDGYGQKREAKDMLTEHLWNVMAFLRARPVFGGTRHTFYRAAAGELRKRGIL